MNERTLNGGFINDNIKSEDGSLLPVVAQAYWPQDRRRWWPAHMAPDSCFEPAEPEPSIEEKLAEKGGAIAAEIERRLQEGATVFLRVFTNADHPRAGEVGRARSVGADSEDGPWVRCLWNNACTSRIRPDEGAILSDSEVLALLNREASDG